MKEAIKFYRWMLENDYKVEYLNFSDEDMYIKFKEDTND